MVAKSAIFGFSVGNAPKIVKGLVDLTKISPEEAIMDCTIDIGEPAAEIKWYKNGKQISAGKKYEMSYKNKRAELKIPTTEIDDGAEYRCEASNIMARVDTKGTLTVHSEYGK